MIFNITLFGLLIRALTLFGMMVSRDLVSSVGHSPVFKIYLQADVRSLIMTYPPALTNSAGLLSTPADLPIPQSFDCFFH